MKLVSSTVLLALAVSLPLAAPAADAPKFPGSAVVVATGNASANNGRALIIWDATDEVADIVSKKQDADTANGRLFHDALHALAANVGALDKSAANVTVRIIYQKTGAVSPVYGTATLQGVERYATVSLVAKDAKGNRDGWQSLKDDAKLPDFVTVKILGTLPQS